MSFVALLLTSPGAQLQPGNFTELAGAIAGFCALVISLYVFGRQLREQRLFALQKVEEDYLREILRLTGRPYQAVRQVLERFERDDPHHSDKTARRAAGAQLNDMLREYREGVMTSIDVIRNTRAARLRGRANDVALTELSSLADLAIARLTALVEDVVSRIDYADTLLLSTPAAKEAWGVDLMLRVPVAEMIAKMYSGRDERRRGRLK